MTRSIIVVLQTNVATMKNVVQVDLSRQKHVHNAEPNVNNQTVVHLATGWFSYFLFTCSTTLKYVALKKHL